MKTITPLDLSIILSSFTIDDNVFDLTKTGMSYYNDFLNEKDKKYKKYSKKLLGKIVYMSPKEYINRCYNDIFKKNEV